jgi:hypothetical protein
MMYNIGSNIGPNILLIHFNTYNIFIFILNNIKMDIYIYTYIHIKSKLYILTHGHVYCNYFLRNLFLMRISKFQNINR